MEKMTFIFLCIIVLYLFISFIRSRKTPAATVSARTEQQVTFKQENTADEQRAAITAAIAAVMGETAYIIKRVYPVATVDEKKSGWRTAGRIEAMSKKMA